MTQAASFKDKFKSGFAVFKWELKSCKNTLIVFSVISSVVIAIVLTLSVVVGSLNVLDYTGYNYNNLQTSLSLFQVIASYLVFMLNAVFTIIYTIRIFSYLHNKRKADLYGSMPISRRTFFVSKTISAYILSIVPTLFFFGVISIISVLFGQPVEPEVARLYVKLLLGAIANISFYALLAVCCGTTLNSVLSFVGINFAYPLSAMFIRGTIKAFFIGMPTSQYSSSFIMKALNSLAAYDGTNIIYWLIFTAVCLFLGILLVKKRKAECAQTSFAYRLPCYIVEILISFIIGMFLGMLFGSLNVLSYGLLGFIFGFILGSVPAYIITHLILYKGFKRVFKSAIPYGATVVTVILLVTFCNFDFFGYNSFVPKEESVKSAGLIDLSKCCCADTESAFGLADMASDDYEDSDNIKTIINFHNSAVQLADKESNEKFGSVWINLMLSNIPSEYMGGYCVSYRLQNGQITYRYYDPALIYSNLFGGDDSELHTAALEKITSSCEYLKNYSSIMNKSVDSIEQLSLSFDNNGSYSDSFYDSQIYVAYNHLVDKKQAAEDRKKILEAYRQDVEEKGVKDSSKSFCLLSVSFSSGDVSNRGALWQQMSSLLTPDITLPEDAVVYSDYTNTIAALREIGIINSDNSVNTDGDYFKSYSSYSIGY